MSEEEMLVAAVRRYADWASRSGRPWFGASVMILTDPTGALPGRVVPVEPEQDGRGSQAAA